VEANSDTSPQDRILSLSLSLATLVTPTVIPPLVFHLASTHLDWGTRHINSLVGPVEGPPSPKHRQQGSPSPALGAATLHRNLVGATQRLWKFSTASAAR
jgi:hypothetical protein